MAQPTDHQPNLKSLRLRLALAVNSGEVDSWWVLGSNPIGRMSPAVEAKPKAGGFELYPSPASKHDLEYSYSTGPLTH